ncbi:hypothetical protein AYI68_g471 [Smittium mucronatum]|uniref:GDP/GTP exchange factor Sec2 N-terminal domain-containing protein n=1 Tax=Smittium mucronatum TaxID=133383 RepID=A0A1R0H8A4_9FUNG|nr:hypothetical protein AYI68_g471 [Smittium mucronatum]
MRNDSMKYLKKTSQVVPRKNTSSEPAIIDFNGNNPLLNDIKSLSIDTDSKIKFEHRNIQEGKFRKLADTPKRVNGSNISHDNKSSKLNFSVNSESNKIKREFRGKNSNSPSKVQNHEKPVSISYITETEFIKIKEQKNDALKELEKAQSNLESLKTSSSKTIADLTDSLSKAKFQLQVETNLKNVAESKLATMECELAELSSNIQVEAQNIVVSERKDRKSQVEKLIQKKKETEDLLLMERSQVQALKTALERLGSLLDSEKQEKDRLLQMLQNQDFEISTVRKNLPFLQIDLNKMSPSVSNEGVYQKMPSLSAASTTHLSDYSPPFSRNLSPDILPMSLDLVALDLAKSSRCHVYKYDSISTLNKFPNVLSNPKSLSPSILNFRMGVYDSDQDTSMLSEFINSPTDRDAYQTPYFLKILKEELEPTINSIDYYNNPLKLSNQLFPSWNKHKRILNSIQENTIVIEKCFFTEQITSSLVNKSNKPLNQLMDNFRTLEIPSNFTPILDLENVKRDGSSGISEWFSSKSNRNTFSPQFQKSPTLVENKETQTQFDQFSLINHPLRRNYTVNGGSSTSPDLLSAKNLVSMSPEILKSTCHLCEDCIFNDPNISELSKPRPFSNISSKSLRPSISQNITSNSSRDFNNENRSIPGVYGYSNCQSNAFYYKFRYSESDNSRKPICFKCHARILSVCEFFRYLRLIRSGLIKNMNIGEIKYNLINLRTIMWSNRLGAVLDHSDS